MALMVSMIFEYFFFSKNKNSYIFLRSCTIDSAMSHKTYILSSFTYKHHINQRPLFLKRRPVF